MSCIFRKTRGGRWAIFGPADVVKAGATVTVELKDGNTVDVEIADTGKPFNKDGIPCVYGYKVASKEVTKAKPRRKRAKRATKTNETATLRSQVEELQAKLAQLTGDASAALAEAGAALADATEGS